MLLFWTLLLLIQFSFSEVTCVPATPSSSLLEDVKNIKEKFSAFSNAFEKWNLVYATQVEPRIVTTSTTLTSIDSNVKNLQERAHIWDTFQLHISAWNDQMSSVDRKLDIISKAQEELLSLETKINSITNLEYKLDSLSKKLDNTQETIAELSRKVDNSCARTDPLFGEFAVRGILSTLKQFERKLDKVQVSSQNLLKQVKMDDIEARSKLTINCNTPPLVEELLTDVSSKVDIIFDKMNGKYEDESDDYYVDNDTAEENATKVIRQVKNSDDDAKLVKKFVKRINQPCRDFNLSLYEVKEALEMIKNNTQYLIGENKREISNCKNENVNENEKVLLKINHLLNYMNYSHTTQDMAIHSHFVEQQDHFESILDKKLKSHCTNFKLPENTMQRINQTLIDVNLNLKPTEKEKSYPVFNINNKLDCSELDEEANDISGVYNFNNDNDDKTNRWGFNKRFCELSDNEYWTVIQRRGTFLSGFLTDFNKNWENYKRGFGDLQGEFWYGNEFIHWLTKDNNVVLKVVLEDFYGNTAYAEFDTFKIGSESENYKITIGGYKGNASDSLTSHNQSMFSTFDRKNDEAPECCPCAASYGGGWWFNSCFESNLNGIYHNNPTSNDYYRGIIWESWLGNYSLKKSKMMIRKRGEEEITTENTESAFSTTIPSYLEDP